MYGSFDVLERNVFGERVLRKVSVLKISRFENSVQLLCARLFIARTYFLRYKKLLRIVIYGTCLQKFQELFRCFRYGVWWNGKFGSVYAQG